MKCRNIKGHVIESMKTTESREWRRDETKKEHPHCKHKTYNQMKQEVTEKNNNKTKRNKRTNHFRIFLNSIKTYKKNTKKLGNITSFLSHLFYRRSALPLPHIKCLERIREKSGN
ncbi:hypothetical protein, unlikely [Trypanosoma brucei gambiense DAL972]|uniref:Uncharacterized protein n=1 Tax=Trypanosoma brucei gambiense (strain MHOM/CI/86/DAL972) TaxID=679716 RepID=D0AA66_TRYB9|nr:hypothetical protein, unlikely [Trypanosoma brucei gambiense DAL972]CBH18567.1 hypothetical protein, unlikely [Trypanosoma brucei gambiense DAL972]|eukprot:XP_011780831.1 hypothetical protein, unlikely [Trypanosoma brucei gambiense DAL972]